MVASHAIILLILQEIIASPTQEYQTAENHENTILIYHARRFHERSDPDFH